MNMICAKDPSEAPYLLQKNLLQNPVVRNHVGKKSIIWTHGLKTTNEDLNQTNMKCLGQKWQIHLVDITQQIKLPMPAHNPAQHFQSAVHYIWGLLLELTQGHLTQIFPTFPNPIVNLDFHMKTDAGLSWVSNDSHILTQNFPTIPNPLVNLDPGLWCGSNKRWNSV